MEDNRRRSIAILLLIGISPFIFNGFYNPLIYKYPILYWTLSLAAWIAMPLGIYLYSTRKGLFTRQDLGFIVDFSTRQKTDNFFLGMLCLPFLLHWLAFYFYDLAIELFPSSSGEMQFSYKWIIPRHGPNRYLIILYLGLTAGFVEEFYYRGMFRLIFKPGRFNTFLYILSSSLFFSIVHWESGIHSMFETFFYGLLAASAYVVIGSIWPLVVAHAFTDIYIYSR